MPTYDYECVECGAKFERFQNMSDEPVAECPTCSGRVERLMSGGVGIIVKGAPASCCASDPADCGGGDCAEGPCGEDAGPGGCCGGGCGGPMQLGM